MPSNFIYSSEDPEDFLEFPKVRHLLSGEASVVLAKYNELDEEVCRQEINAEHIEVAQDGRIKVVVDFWPDNVRPKIEKAEALKAAKEWLTSDYNGRALSYACETRRENPEKMVESLTEHLIEKIYKELFN